MIKIKNVDRYIERAFIEDGKIYRIEILDDKIEVGDFVIGTNPAYFYRVIEICAGGVRVKIPSFMGASAIADLDILKKVKVYDQNNKSDKQ